MLAFVMVPARVKLLVGVLLGLVLAGCAGDEPKQAVRFTEQEQKLIAAMLDGSMLLDATMLKKGDVGLFASPVKVAQAFPDDKFVGVIDGQRLLFTEMSSTHSPEGQELRLDTLAFECIGEANFTTEDDASGSMMTVRAFEPWRAIKEAERQLAEQKAKRCPH